ncbi:MAG: zf-HC2 domain-containing protein [Erysipelotrichaceae bacterium]
MKYNHDVIKDLLPLYIDDVLSSASRKIVDEHLGECEDCREYLDKLNDSKTVELNIADAELEKEHADILKLMHKKIVRRNIIISLLSIFIMISIFSLSLFYLKNTTEYIDINQLNVEEKGKDLILEIEHGVWNQISQVRFTLSENGKEYDCIALCADTTKFDELFSSFNAMSQYTLIYNVSDENNADRIYYSSNGILPSNGELNDSDPLYSSLELIYQK